MTTVRKLSELKPNPLMDFPRTEHWRFMTDGWQHKLGPTNFRDKYYQGILQGFEHVALQVEPRTKITPEMIQELYLKSFQFEPEFDEYQKTIASYGEQTKQKAAFRGIAYEANFCVCPGSRPAMVGLSIAGLKEFIPEVDKAEDEKRWKLVVVEQAKLKGESRDALVCDSPSMNSEMFGHNLDLFKKALVAFMLNPKYALYIVNYTLPLKKVLFYVQRSIDKFYSEMHEIDKEEKSLSREQIKDKKIAAMVKLIRTLNQDHWLPDGNGRVVGFLLLNLLLLQHLNCMMINMTPAHVTGFSTEELVAEVKNGVAQFEDIKITGLKNILANLTIENIADEKKISTELKAKLNSDPMIAMAQLNELFLQIRENVLIVPVGFNKEQKNEKNDEAHEKILNLLKDIYQEKLQEFVANPPEKLIERVRRKKELREWIQMHEISAAIEIAKPGFIEQQLDVYFKPPAEVRDQVISTQPKKSV